MLVKETTQTENERQRRREKHGTNWYCHSSRYYLSRSFLPFGTSSAEYYFHLNRFCARTSSRPLYGSLSAAAVDIDDCLHKTFRYPGYMLYNYLVAWNTHTHTKHTHFPFQPFVIVFISTVSVATAIYIVF